MTNRLKIILNNVRFFARTYRNDLITLISSVVVLVVTYQSSIDELVKLRISLIVSVSAFIAITYIRTKEKDFYYVSLSKYKQKDDWVGRGIFEYSRVDKSFIITSSYSGFLFPKCFDWTNYKVVFEFKILHACVGVLVRAFNPANYVMMQISASRISPHIRINNAWARQDPDELTYPDLSLDDWHRCEITLDRDKVNIHLTNGGQVTIQRSWEIPSGEVLFQYSTPQNSPSNLFVKMPIILDYGTIGFRNDGAEKALVRNLFIEKI